MCKQGNQIPMNFCVNNKQGSAWDDWKEEWKKDPIGLVFSVDACLALHIWKMNTQLGITTLTHCCLHGKPIPKGEGQIMIDSHSVYNAIKAGYDVVTYGRVWDDTDGGDLEKPVYEIRI